ncbi:MAG: hypothetical protein KC502_22950 [Myxococcales bacterium]|nr:hypothetical protein [Myxococcales bacterium]
MARFNMKPIPLNRVVLTGLLLISSFAGCSADGPAADTKPDEWRVDVEDLSAGLFAVWGHDDGPLWAVGADDGKGPMLLQHSAKGTWDRIDTSAHPGDLWWIHGPDAKTLYLVGDKGRVLRWTADSKTFTPMPTPTKRVLYGCWAADATHIWAVGGDPKGLETGVVLMSDGVTWTEVKDLPAVPAGTSFFKVFGTSATDLRVIGTAGQVLHFDGKKWTRENLLTTVRLITIHGDGDDLVIVGGTGNGAVFEHGAGGWVNNSPEAIQALNGVRVRDGKAWAVGFRGTLVDRTATGWELRDETPTALDLHGVFIDKNGTGWAVGGNMFSKPASEGMILKR